MPAIDAVGIDNYLPLSDWRDGDHARRQPGRLPRALRPRYLARQHRRRRRLRLVLCQLGGDRDAQPRTPITDGAYGKPWVFRYKDLAGWWGQPHFDRIGGVRGG